ncbi:MAG: hypothetical protein ABSG65_27045 [Bryobacteraceae bacterium]|jgi:hypothetical protein
MFRPVGVACSYDGAILVLEDTKSDSEIGGAVVSRISACDLEINTVNRFFDNEGKPSPWLELSTAGDYHYLDIAAVGDEKMTYIYVLYYTGDGSHAAQYHMAIYRYGLAKPESNPLVEWLSGRSRKHLAVRARRRLATGTYMNAPTSMNASTSEEKQDTARNLALPPHAGTRAWCRRVRPVCFRMEHGLRYPAAMEPGAVTAAGAAATVVRQWAQHWSAVRGWMRRGPFIIPVHPALSGAPVKAGSRSSPRHARDPMETTACQGSWPTLTSIDGWIRFS